MFEARDELLYEYYGTVWGELGVKEFMRQMKGMTLSDSGYCWWFGFVNSLFGVHVLPDRILKCCLDAFACVLIYNLGKRSFSEFTGRIAGIFYMLMPNMWYYCGITLKESVMAFLVVLYVERGDLVLRSRKVLLKDMLLTLQ
jgi:hypothetical protein